MRKALFLRVPLLLVLFLVLTPGRTQEFNAKVQVIAPQIQSTPKRIWQSLETAITQLMNTRRFTNYNYTQTERLDVNLLLTINEQPSADRFKGTLQVSYSRPVYGTDYLSPVMDILDQNVEFQFLENTQIEFSPDRFTNNLASIVGFYAYFLLGVDADTFKSMGGSEFYNIAQQVVNNAQNTSEPGWKAFEDQKNRYWLLDNQQQAVFRPLREFLYNYHINGMDILAKDPSTARKNMLAAIDKLKTVHQAKPASYNMQVVFNAKGNELVEVFKPADPADKTKLINTVSVIDPGNIARYQNLMRSN
ncbi:MAG: DUF4835 family protein [Flavobacteriales bacterium]|nr:DUF4835 family protein [Flavobacteriales bacterium]